MVSTSAAQANTTTGSTTFRSPPYSEAWEPRGEKARMSGGVFPSPPWAGGGVEPPSSREVPEVRREGPVFGRRGNIFGNYFGWGEALDDPLSPASPVDLVAWYHDQEYGAIQRKYGASSDPVEAYFEPFTRFDRPEFMYDLAMADLRFNENSWSFIGQAMDQGFYRGAAELLAADIVMSSLAWVFHTALAGVRLAVYGTQVVFGGLYKVFAGEMSIGNYLVSIMEGGAKILAAVGYFIAGTVRGVWNFGAATLRGIARDPVRGLSGVALGAAAGSVFGPIGTVVGGIIGGAIGGGGGCFITTAVCEAHGLPDEHELLVELRRFRDGYMSRDPSARSLVEAYYRVSPLIVAEFALRPDKDDIYRELFARYLVPAFNMVRRGRYRAALSVYRAMLLRAASKAGLRHELDRFPAIDRYRSLPDWDPSTTGILTAT